MIDDPLDDPTGLFICEPMSEDGRAEDWLDYKMNRSLKRAAERKARLATYRKENPEKAQQSRAQWAAANPDKARQSKKDWAAANPEKALQSKKTYRDAPEAKAEHFWNHRFVAIDSEGQDYPGNDIWRAGVCYPEHGTYLWCAATMDVPHKIDCSLLEGSQLGERWLCPRPEYLVHPLTKGKDKRKLSAVKILEWLLSLPEKFPAQVVDRRGRRSLATIFIMFGSGYDWTQLLSQMPQATAYEIVKQQRMSDKKDIGNAPVFWKSYALNYIKGKWMNIWKLRDHNNPYKRDAYGDFLLNRNGEKIPDYIKHIQIYETFSYYQTGFPAIVKNMVRQGMVTQAEQDLIVRMKAARSNFADYDIEEIKPYPALECRLLALQMNEYRKGFAELGVRPDSWHGPGAVANKIIQTYNIRKEHYGSDITAKKLAPQQVFAHHAYFGGHIEMIKQGYLGSTSLHTYDLASAYPDGTTQLPSLSPWMGRWVHKMVGDLQFNTLADLRAMVEKTSMVSMFTVEFKFPEFVKKFRPAPHLDAEEAIAQMMDRSEFVPFFPLPYRTKGGYILFPSSGYGRYTRDDLLAAIAWMERFTPKYPCSSKSPSGETTLFQLEEAWVWEPYAADVIAGKVDRPFAFLRDMYLKRRAIKVAIENGAPYDSREKSYKLVFNSIYGKTAQRVGEEGKPPPSVNPYYAAAITASCRRRVMEFALRDPSAIVFFATDGIVATRPLHTPENADALRVRFTTATTDLGDWEYKEAAGGIFVQSGVYVHWTLDKEGKKVATSKLRGASTERYKTDEEGKIWLVENTLAAWRAPFDPAAFPSITADYKVFKTVCSCLQTPEQWQLAGRWSKNPGEAGAAKRTIDVHGASRKRGINTARVLDYVTTSYYEALRCTELIDTLSEPNTDQEMSRMRPADWLSEEWELAAAYTEDEAEALAGVGEDI